MFWFFVFLFTIQLLFAYLYRYRKDEKVETTLDFPPVSILICGKNEAHHFKQFLPLVLSQQYIQNKWELVVVNDASEDESAQVLGDLQKEYPQLRIVHIDAFEKRKFPGKKHALSVGLNACQYELVLLTDADCYPASTLWLQEMAKAYAQKRKTFSSAGLYVLAYGAYQNAEGLLNRFIRWETRHTFMQYASWAKIGLPYMGVGRNLMYEKTPVLNYMQDEQFAHLFAQTASGDDDLIISALANVENTIIVDSKETHTISIAQANWHNWWKQKTRHVSSGKYYAPIVKAGLGLYAISSLLFYILSIILLVNTSGLIQNLVLILVFIRSIAFWANAFKWSAQLDRSNTAWFYPIGEGMWLIYNFAISPFIFWKNKQQWK